MASKKASDFVIVTVGELVDVMDRMGLVQHKAREVEVGSHSSMTVCIAADTHHSP
jgi:hypothetical protein